MIVEEFFEDSNFELQNESSSSSSASLLKRYLRIEKKHLIAEGLEKGYVDFVFILLTQNHLPFYKRLPESIRSRSIVLRSAVIEADMPLINSIFKKSWRRKAKRKGFLKSISIDSRSRKTVERHFVDYFLLRKATREIAQRIGPKKIILFKAENVIARGILRECELVDQPSVVMQHGLIPEKSDQFRNLKPSSYFVWGEEFRRRLESNQASCDISVSGNIKTDDLFNRPKQERDTTSVLAMPNTGDSHTPIEEVQLLVHSMLIQAKEKPELNFYIKPHPADINNNVESLMVTGMPSNLNLIPKTDKVDLSRYGVLVINNSASGLEAAIAKTPQIVVCGKKEDVMVPQYLNYGSAEWAFDGGSLGDAIEKISASREKYEANCEDLTRDYLSYQGTASARLEELLEC